MAVPSRVMEPDGALAGPLAKVAPASTPKEAPAATVNEPELTTEAAGPLLPPP